jgi:hypothetical protein
MKLALAAACLAATSLFASQALAGPPATATLEQPLAAKVKIVADGAVWVCAAASCVASYTPDESLFGVSECKDLAKQVGRVTSFQNSVRPALQPAALDKCNTAARAAVTAAR